jgi:hypothetical protein
LFLIVSSGLGGNAGSGVMVEILNAGVQTQKFLRSFPPLEPLLVSLLTSCGTVRMFDQVVAARATDHLLVVDVH